MAYLNWTDQQGVRTEISEHPKWSQELRLSLIPERYQQLSSLLRETFAQEGAELRMDLPDKWTLFWKVRESESRIFLAHPEKDEWVANVSLESPHAWKLVEALEGKAAVELSVAGLGVIHRMINLDVRIAQSEP